MIKSSGHTSLFSKVDSWYIYVLFAISYVSIPLCTGAPMIGLDDAMKIGKAGPSRIDNLYGAGSVRNLGSETFQAGSGSTNDALGSAKGVPGSNTLRQGSGSREASKLAFSSKQATESTSTLPSDDPYAPLRAADVLTPQQLHNLYTKRANFNGFTYWAPEPSTTRTDMAVPILIQELKSHPTNRMFRAGERTRTATGRVSERPTDSLMKQKLSTQDHSKDLNSVSDGKYSDPNQLPEVPPRRVPQHVQPDLQPDEKIEYLGDLWPADALTDETKMNWRQPVGHILGNKDPRAPSKPITDPTSVKNPKSVRDQKSFTSASGSANPIIKTRMSKNPSGFFQKLKRFFRWHKSQ